MRPIAWAIRLLATGVLLTGVARPAAADASDRKSKDEIRIMRLAVQPAAEPDPALKYVLLPTMADQTPGNAMALYSLATGQAIGDTDFRKKVDKAHKWLETPLDKLPREEIREMIPAHVIRQIELAARRERCHWDLPVREEGFSLLLPSLSTYRHLAWMLALEARLLIAERRYDLAVDKLQTGFAMARHMAEGPTLINALVASAIDDIMAGQVAELIRAPDSPNLYWALTSLPRPAVDLRRSLGFEIATIYFSFPELRNPTGPEFTRQAWEQMLMRLDSLAVRDPQTTKLTVTVVTAKLYPEGKRYLLTRGYTPEQVEAMPVHQVAAIYSLAAYERLADDLFKWFFVPYWQAHERFPKMKQRMKEARARMEGVPFTWVLPSLHRVYFVTTKLDRRIAALRCIEAIRMYATGHEATLPAELSDITEVPLPMNPMTGKPFGYSVKGNQATLEAPAPAGSSPQHSTRYVITLVD